MSFYSDLATTAAALLSSKGQAVTLRRRTAGAYDRETGQTAGDSTVDVSRKAAVFSFKDGTTQIKGIAVEASDRKALMEAGTVPTTDDYLIVGGVSYAILSVSETNPAGTPVIYSLHLRK